MLRNSLYNLAGGTVRLGLGIISVPLLIKIVGIEQYGIYSLASSLISIAALSEWSIALTVTVFVAESLNNCLDTKESKENQKAALVVVVLLSLATVCLLGFVSFLLPFFFGRLNYENIRQMQVCCQVGAVLVGIRLFQQFFIGLLQAHQQYGLSNSLSTGFTITLTTSTLLTAWYYERLLPIFCVQVLVSLLFLLIYAWVSTQYRFLDKTLWSSALKRDLIRRQAIYSFRTWTGTFGGVLFTHGDKLIVGKLLGAELVGTYSALTSITTQINQLSSLPLQPIIPEISHFQSNISSENSSYIKKVNKKKILYAYKLNVYLATFIGIMIIGLSPEILTFLSLSESLLELKSNLILLSAIYTLYSFNALGYFILLALKKTKIFLRIQMIGGFSTLIAIGLLSTLYPYSLTGAILGNSLYCITYAFVWYAARSLLISPNTFIKYTIFPVLTICILAYSSHQIHEQYTRISIVFLICFFVGWRLLRNFSKYRIERLPLVLHE